MSSAPPLAISLYCSLMQRVPAELSMVVATRLAYGTNISGKYYVLSQEVTDRRFEATDPQIRGIVQAT